MSAVWKKYVRLLCSQAWAHDVRTTEHVLAKIQGLAQAGNASEAAVSHILVRAGVGQATADLVSASIGRTMASHTHQPDQTPSRLAG